MSSTRSAKSTGSVEGLTLAWQEYGHGGRLRASQSHERVPRVSMLSESLKTWSCALKVSDEPFEFGCLTQPFEMWIDPEERPTGETGVDAALQPRHGPVAVTEYCIHAGDLVVGVMRVAERTRKSSALRTHSSAASL